MERFDEEANETIIDKIAEKVAELLVDQPIEAIREAVDRDDEEASEVFETGKTSVELISEAILEATGESKDPGSNLSRSKTLECL